MGTYIKTEKFFNDVEKKMSPEQIHLLAILTDDMKNSCDFFKLSEELKIKIAARKKSIKYQREILLENFSSNGEMEKLLKRLSRINPDDLADVVKKLNDLANEKRDAALYNQERKITRHIIESINLKEIKDPALREMFLEYEKEIKTNFKHDGAEFKDVKSAENDDLVKSVEADEVGEKSEIDKNSESNGKINKDDCQQ